MANVKIKSSTKTITEHVVKEISIPGCRNVLVDEIYENGELTDQWWRVEKPFHKGYDSKKMNFYYYGREVDPVKEYDDLINHKLQPVLIKDLSSFKDFNHLYCNWLGMDRCFYSLTSEWSLPVPIRIELWESYYDLLEAEKHLKTIDIVFETGYTENCVQNYDISGTQKLWFKIIPTLEMIKKKVGMDSMFWHEHIKESLGLENFRINQEEE